MNVNRIPLFLMLHRIIESNNQIKSDYDIKFSNFELIAKSIYEINNNLKKKILLLFQHLMTATSQTLYVQDF